uniref:Uncharacterized protein n=1 Tax=Arundo donax TaxID=35708 RepID=A0A0A9AZJ7_ARUDO
MKNMNRSSYMLMPSLCLTQDFLGLTIKHRHKIDNQLKQ